MSDWQSYNQQPPPPTSGAATASLVLGICGLVVCPFVCSVLALVFGYQARGQIDESGGQIGGRSSAVAGIVLGWVGVGLCVLALAFFIFVVVAASVSSTSGTLLIP
jgi:hypothetical protein